MLRSKPILISLLAVTSLVSLCGPQALAGDKVLKGTVKEGVTLPSGDGGGGTGPSLSRSDIEAVGDPFGGIPTGQGIEDTGLNQMLDAPQQAFQGYNIPKKSFGLGAGVDEFSGQ